MLADIAAGAENQNALRHVALLSGLKGAPVGDDVGKLFARDIQMRHQTHNRRGVNQDIPFPQIVAKRGGLCFANANKQHIRFVAYDLRARFPKLLRQPAALS